MKVAKHDPTNDLILLLLVGSHAKKLDIWGPPGCSGRLLYGGYFSGAHR